VEISTMICLVHSSLSLLQAGQAVGRTPNTLIVCNRWWRDLLANAHLYDALLH
jgi:hypothetical protein